MRPAMALREIFLDPERYYAVYVDEQTGEKVAVAIITAVGWYELKFRLTEEEFSWLETDKAQLDDLMARFAHDKGRKFYRDRLVR